MFTQKCKYLYISYCRRVVSFSKPDLEVHPLTSTFLVFVMATFFCSENVSQQDVSNMRLAYCLHCLHLQQIVSSFWQTTHSRNATFIQNITCIGFGRAASRTIVTIICSSITLLKQSLFILQACVHIFTCAYEFQRINCLVRHLARQVYQNTILLVKSPATTIVPLYSLLCHNIGIVRPVSMDQGFIRILGSAMSFRSITLYVGTLDPGDKAHLHRHLKLSASCVLVWGGFSENSIICHYQPFKMQPSKGIPVFLTLWGFLNGALVVALRAVLRVNAGVGSGISWQIVYVSEGKSGEFDKLVLLSSVVSIASAGYPTWKAVIWTGWQKWFEN